MPTLPGTTTETIEGIEFAIDVSADGVLLGHCWAQDEVSGEVYGMVVTGADKPEVLHRWRVMLKDMRDYQREDNQGVEPRFVGKGWDPNNPPART